jgi:hypothetical protein
VLRSSSFTRRHRGLRVPLALSAAAALSGLARPAQAEVSSWASVSSGPTWLDAGGYPSRGFETVGSLTMQAGMGTSPATKFIGGGLFHLQTHFGKGTDLGLLGRVATQGFVLGNWGAALDLGGYARFWGDGSEGALGYLSLGAPWGITLSAGGGLGTNDARQFGVLLGVDFARLTVFRSSGTQWFPNPYPGYSAQR